MVDDARIAIANMTQPWSQRLMERAVRTLTRSVEGREINEAGLVGRQPVCVPDNLYLTLAPDARAGTLAFGGW